MDLREVRTFVAVAELGTVSKASEQLHTTQPALSRPLRSVSQPHGCSQGRSHRSAANASCISCRMRSSLSLQHCEQVARSHAVWN